VPRPDEADSRINPVIYTVILTVIKDRCHYCVYLDHVW